MTNGSLGGVRVIDVTTNVAGPFATRILADLGADVVKVERPVTGDDTRSWGPPFWDGHGLTFLDLNRNKRSVVLDLTRPDNRDRLHELVAGADVFVQNLRAGSMAKLGFGPEELTGRHPRLVYCDITGFGAVGPKAADPAFDPLTQAYSGLMSLTGEDGRPPVRIPISVLDKGSALWAVIAIFDALRSRDATGCGAIVRTSLLETALAWESVQVMSYLANGEVPGRLGSGSVGVGSYGAFATADGHVMIAAGNDRLWRKLCGALGVPALADDPRFLTNSDRVRNQADVVEVVESNLRHWTTEVATARLFDAGVPAGAVNDIAATLAEEQVAAIGMVVELPHDEIADLRGMRLPISVSNGTPGAERPAPALGAHDDEVLGG